MRKDLSVEYANVHLVRCKPENTIGWRSMNKTPSRPVGTEKDVKYEARPGMLGDSTPPKDNVLISSLG